MAVKVTGVPLGVDGAIGVMLMPVITAAVTVRLAAGEVMPFFEAVIVVPPSALPVTTPVVPSTVATAAPLDSQFTWLVMSAVLPSEYVPVAVRNVF